MSSTNPPTDAPEKKDGFVGGAPKYRRRLRNMLIDVRLQLRYTSFILGVALLLTGLLGYKIFDAVRASSEIINVRKLVEDSLVVAELEQQLRENDRTVLWGIIGLGVVVVFSITGLGIWITHKVAGPLYKVAGICARVRDNKLAPPLRQQLRKGDELQEFYGTFRDMHEALRMRAAEEARVLGDAVAALELAVPGDSAQAKAALEKLRRLRAEKDDSLEG